MRAGDVIADRYRLDGPIGEGGMGTVWAATHVSTGRRLAVKFLKSRGVSERTRFAAEARALGKLDHRGCVEIVDVGELEDHTPYLVSELVAGQSLAAVRSSRIPAERVLDIATQLAATLQYAHEQGVVHRDLKPENIILTPDGGVKVLDFGIAKIVGHDGPALTETGEVLGTPLYMSPEQIRQTRAAGPPSDQYALGVIIWELLEGHRPFDGDSFVDVCMQHISAPVPGLRPDCPPRLAAAVRRMLAKDPADRYPDLRAVVAALDPGVLTPAPAAARAPSRAWLPIALSVLVGGAAVTALIVSADPPDERPTSRPNPLSAAPSAAPDAAPDSPPAQPTPALDLGSATGCGVDIAPAPFAFRFGAENREVWVQAPRKYLHDVPQPALVLLTYRRRFGSGYAERWKVADAAREAGYLLIAPEPVQRDYEPATAKLPVLAGTPPPPHVRPWREDDDPEYVLAALEEAQRLMCIDPRRIAVMGHADGAHMVRRLACNADAPFAAMIMTGDAEPDARMCPIHHFVPTLRIAGRDDDFVPFLGGRSCHPDHGKFRSSAASDAVWTSALQCQPDARETNGCRTFECTRAPFTTCSVAGGHYLSATGAGGAFGFYDPLAEKTFKALADDPDKVTWFDPPECGEGKVLHATFATDVLPFLQTHLR